MWCVLEGRFLNRISVKQFFYILVSSLYQIASHLPNQIAFKHQIKSVERLLGNTHIHQSRASLYKKLLYRWLSSFDNMVVIVDGSPLTKNQEWHVLRASIALKS